MTDLPTICFVRATQDIFGQLRHDHLHISRALIKIEVLLLHFLKTYKFLYHLSLFRPLYIVISLYFIFISLFSDLFIILYFSYLHFLITVFIYFSLFHFFLYLSYLYFFFIYIFLWPNHQPLVYLQTQINADVLDFRSISQFHWLIMLILYEQSLINKPIGGHRNTD